MIPDDLALQLALGNLDVHTREALDDFDPSTFKVCTELCHNVVKIIILLVLGQVKNTLSGSIPQLSWVIIPFGPKVNHEKL